ncbi:hypothetical protein FFLO_02299 [Filobasidium floriforme]|uniref:Uncharacterized protein n=1 Tax=Filobasidium floriforme TaxID=5210 RepID=A0A8K0JPB0_9TREE|nr:hypothetical protein FFLO_02299 [Filobasidium floriforme]
MSKHELYEKLHFVFRGEQLGCRYDVLDNKQEVMLDEILEIEDRVADIVFDLFGEVSPALVERGRLGIDGRPQECDTTEKKALWDTSRGLITQARRKRDLLACAIRADGWIEGVFMGREWMKGASPALVSLMGGVLQGFANRPDYKSTSSLTGELHYLRRLLGEGRFYESEWIPILDMFRRTDSVMTQSTLKALSNAVRLPEARQRWADISSRARELWRESGKSFRMPIAIDANLANVKAAQALRGVVNLGNRPLIAAGRRALRAQVEDKVGTFPHTETWASYFADVHQLKLGNMSGMTFCARATARESVFAKVMGLLERSLYEKEKTDELDKSKHSLHRFLVEFHYRELDADGRVESAQVDATIIEERFMWSKPATRMEVDWQNEDARADALAEEQALWDDDTFGAGIDASQSQPKEEEPELDGMFDFGTGNGEEGDREGDLDMDITIDQGTEPARQSDKPATDVVDEVGKATTEVTTGANKDTVREGAQKAGTGESFFHKALGRRMVYIDCTKHVYPSLKKENATNITWKQDEDGDWLPASIITASESRTDQQARDARAKEWNNFVDTVKTKAVNLAERTGTTSVTICARPMVEDDKGTVVLFTSPGMVEPKDESWEPMLKAFWENTYRGAADLCDRIEERDAKFVAAKPEKEKGGKRGKAGGK